MGRLSGIRKEKLALLAVAIMIGMPFVSAMGLTSPAYVGDSITMYRGETMVVTFWLQNMVGGKDIKTKIMILEGGEIAKLIDGKEIYTIPFGRKDIPINLQLSIPKENAQHEYMVRFMVVSVPTDRSRPVEIATGLEKRFTVGIDGGSRSPTGAAQIQTEPVPSPVIEEPKPLWGEDTKTIIITAAVIIIVIVLYRMVMRHRKKRARELPYGNYEL